MIGFSHEIVELAVLPVSSFLLSFAVVSDSCTAHGACGGLFSTKHSGRRLPSSSGHLKDFNSARIGELRC